MEQQDYGMIAKTLNDAKPYSDVNDSFYSVKYDQWEKSCLLMAYAFRIYDENFSKYHFLEACGVGEE